MAERNSKRGFDKRAMSPVISTVILTGSIVALLSVALVFANNFIGYRVAESEFNAAIQFMQTIGLEIDDVAWTMGRKGTIRYSARYGEITLVPSTLNYTIYVQTDDGYQLFASYEVGVLLFNLPTSRYSIGNGYHQLIFPSQSDALTLKGASAPIARVFAVEKLPMDDGSYLRVVVAPSIRFLNSTITMSGNSTHYAKLYLPLLTLGSSPRLSQTVTLTGSSVGANTIDGVTCINVTVSFPSQLSGFDASFFNFPDVYEVIDVTDDSVLEFYVGEVTVEFGTNH